MSDQSSSEIHGADSTEEVVDILNEEPADEDGPLDLEKEEEKGEEKEEDEEEEEEESEEDEDEEDEEEELKLKEEDEEEENEELIVPTRNKEILKKYPNFFKEFPFVKSALAINKQWSEMFGTLGEAQEVLERSEQLKEFEGDLLTGKTESLLKSVKEVDSKAFDKIVDNYLPALAKVDKDAYLEVIGNVIKHTVKNMHDEGKENNDEELQTAAAQLNKYIFGTTKFNPPTVRAQQDGKENEVEIERKQFMKERFETTRNDLETKVQNVLKATVDSNIDPKKMMPPFVKKQAVREAIEGLHAAINKDQSFKRNLNRLWDKAFESKFSKDSVEGIRKAYLTKARVLLPSVIKTTRREALKGLSVKREVKDRSGPIRPGRSAPENNSRKGEIPKGMSARDFIMSD